MTFQNLLTLNLKWKRLQENNYYQLDSYRGALTFSVGAFFIYICRMKRIFALFVLVVLPICVAAQQKNISREINKYGQTLYYINNYYLDTTNASKLVDAAIVATLRELDPHSSYISAEDVKAMNEPLEAEFEGIGVEFAIIGDTLTVQATIAGGPSEKVGILAGDKIVKVDGENIAGISLTNEKVYKFLRGEKGTRVDLGIVRRGEREELLFTVVRDKIPLNSVDAVYLTDEGVLYIKLSRFAATSAQEILSAFDTYPQRKGVILDLRGNSGGYLYTAIQIANEFLKKGELIVYTEGRSVRTTREFANGDGVYQQGPLAILVDENSASASEILSGAVQDWDRGFIVGRKTFGKGLVQQLLPLNDGAQLRLTVARYHTPSGRGIQAPYQEGKRDAYYMQTLERYQRGESFSKDSIHFPDSLKYQTLVTHRTVFGGGGIMPDIFVPQDTSSYTPYYGQLLRRGIVQEYVNALTDENRVKWGRKYGNFSEFEREFYVSDKMFDGLVDFASKRGIEPVDEEIKVSRRELEIYIRALVASSIIDRNSFYRVLHKYNDPEFGAALETILKWDEYSQKYNITNR